MIKIIEIPQRADQKITYEIKGEILEITIDEKKEIFDFTDLPNGELESVEVKTLPLNPILSARKNEGILTVELLRFYSFEEKEVFENGEDKLEKPARDNRERTAVTSGDSKTTTN